MEITYDSVPFACLEVSQRLVGSATRCGRTKNCREKWRNLSASRYGA